MKRIILIISALLMGVAVRAQSVDYTCRYWFDQNYAQAVTTTFGDSIWQAQLDVGTLSEGLHTLHLHILAADMVSVLNIEGDSLYHAMDTVIMRWSAPQSYLFLKINGTPAEELAYHYWFDQDFANVQSGIVGDGHLLLDVDDLENGLHAFHVMLKGEEYSASQTYYFLRTDTWQNGSANYVYHCWFDEDFAHQQTDTLGTGHLFLDVADLEEGMHTVHVMVKGSTLTATQSYMFMKAETFSADILDMSHLVYHCWFDQDFEHRVTDSLGDGNFLLDVDGLEDGLHTVHVMLEGSALTTTQSYMFMKMPVENPSTELQYHCWFDQDYDNVQTGLLGSGIFELEVGNLPNGIHTVNVQLDNETLAAPQSYLFYKIPLGGNGIARWEYWLNGDYSNRTSTNINPVLDTLDIISLLPVGHPAIRSSCFHFHPNGDEPYINAKNEISFRFWDAESRFMNMSRLYVDEQVQQEIVAEIFERNTTETFVAPRDNQIQWFKLDAVMGDSLSFIASKACTMQLFAPSGEEVFNVSGPESIILKGLHAWEDGTYYLAVHDQTGSGETLSVTYNWVYRYAILAYDVHLVGNGGCSTITFQGNGFNSLLVVYLLNYQNDTIHCLDIGHESNTTTTVTFDLYQVNLGVYDAVFQFYGETIRVNGALEVQEPVDILLTSSVSFPSQFLRNTPCTYTYTITNNGNMSAYGIPIFAYISSLSLEGVSHIEIEGLGLRSIVDYIDQDSLSESDKEELRIWGEEMGDAFSFFEFSIVDEESGKPIVVRSNYFFMNFAPFETKTLSFQITADEILDVWITIPDGVIQPLVFIPNRGFADGFCCVQDKVSCILDLFCNVLDLADRVTNLVPGTTAAMALKAANCICGLVSSLNTSLSYILCEGDEPENLFDAYKNNLSTVLDINGLVGSVTNCLADLIPINAVGRAKKIKDLANVARTLTNQIADSFLGFTGYNSTSNCYKAFYTKKPNCPPGDHEGGSSEPVTSFDPNDIRGYLSESGSHYMRQEIQNVQYEIEFENDTTLATAAAHTIIMRDTLDATKFDLNSLAARSVTIGDKRLDLNGEQTFARTLDLRPELYVIAQINQDYDPTTGIVEWTIQSLDPMTMEPTDDPNQGVMPVNYFGNGVGFIDYSINLKQAFADGTAIRNRAGIIFDQEEVIMTPTWTNTVDALKPTSHIEEVIPVADSLSFSFVSEDNRSGVWYHSLYYRNASTEQEWQVRKAQIFEDSFVLHLEDLLTTEYLVIAVDSAGNREDKEMVAEYIYTASGLHFVTEGNWSTASNWQEGSLPGADDMVFIDAPCQLDQDAEVAALVINNCYTLTVQSGKTLTVNGLLSNTSAEGLVIEDGAQLVNASANVAATVKKDVQAYNNGDAEGWYTIASPMNGMAIEGSGYVTPEYDLYRYNETNLNGEEWENYKANLADFTTFEKGRGYLFANSNSFSPVFIGMLNNTDVTCSLTCTNRPNDPLSGFNLIGNPFPHNIYKGSGAAIDNANLASGYYTLTNEGTWQAHTFEDAILPGQGILVKATAPTVLTIAKSTAIATSETDGAKRETSPLRIIVKGENGMDQTFVYIGRGNSMEKMAGFVAQEPSLWVRDNDKDYAIAHVKKAYETLELCFSSKQSGDFTLTVDRNETEFEYLQLVDHVTGLTVDLLKQPTYGFHATGQEPDARFSIRFKVAE